MRRRNDEVTIEMTPCGVTLAHRREPGAAVEYCGVVVRAGSRNDPTGLFGLAHFVEHTIFKGTARRSSWHIINRMERVGGELNAYTTKEETVIYTAAPRGNAARAMELVADLVTSSRFPRTEIDKEREVVADEINSYLDSPSDAVFDDFEDLVFAGTPLGHNILGNEDALRGIGSAECRRYLDTWYSKANLVVFYQGPAPQSRVAALVERYFAALPDHRCEHEAISGLDSLKPFDVTRSIDAHQAHTVLGCVVPGMYSRDKYAMSLLTNILGGPGMNSLLNVALREKRGLVYSVEAATGMMTDCGLFTVYFGCDPADTDRCCALVREQIDRVASTPLPERMLSAAKKQYIGQLAVASDNRESLAISTGRGALFFNNILSPEESRQRILAVTPGDLSAAAASLASLSRLTLV